MKKVETSAPSNIALVKYWGKRHTKLNLPLTSSFSVSLTNMRSHATITEASGKEDEWDIHGNPSKAQRVLECARAATEDRRPLNIRIFNDFPSGAGLASSASSMAALALALNEFLENGSRSLEEISHWSRLGSGSSVRSLYPGYVLWDAGTDPEGKDCIAHTRFSAAHMPLSLIVCVVDDQPKPIGSTAAMERSRDTSPLYDDFHNNNTQTLAEALEAVEQKDFYRLAEISESNCQAMHAVMQASEPPVNYFKTGTKQAIEHVQKMRQSGIPCFFTIDAGPNVKIFCKPEAKDEVRARCEGLSDVKRLLIDEVSDTSPV